MTFRNSVEKIQLSLKSKKKPTNKQTNKQTNKPTNKQTNKQTNKVYKRADRYTFVVISRSVLLRTTDVSDKICRENQNTQFVFSGVL